jgi:hypothetical protein
MVDPFLAGAIAAGAAHAESRMTETIACGPEAETVDESTGDTVTVTDPQYDGIAQVKYPTLTPSDREASGQQVVETDVVLKMPLSAPILAVGWVVRVSASAIDQSLVGRRYRVTAPPQSGQVTSHRYPVEEVS